MLKDKIVRYKLVDAHHKLVRNGKFEEGRKVLHLLALGYIYLGLSDTDWNVETVCESCGCYIWYDSRGNRAKAHVKAVNEKKWQ